MALHLSRAVSDGLRRTLTKTGGLLFIGFLIVQLGTQATINTAVASLLPADSGTQLGPSAGLVLPVSGTVAFALFCVLLVCSAAFFAVIARAIVQPLDEISTMPADATRRLGRTTFAMLVGGTVVSVLVFVGTLFLIVPGLFLATSFLFILFTIAAEDRGVIGGLKRSWALAGGSRLRLLALVVMATVFGGVVGGLAPLFSLLGLSVAGEVMTAVVTAGFMAPYYGILAASYLQLRGDLGGAKHGSPNPSDAAGVPEL